MRGEVIQTIARDAFNYVKWKVGFGGAPEKKEKKKKIVSDGLDTKCTEEEKNQYCGRDVNTLRYYTLNGAMNHHHTCV